MVDFRWFTKKDCERAIATSAEHDLGVALDHAFRCSPTAQSDDRVLLLAFDGGKIAGRILFTYGLISDNGRPIRVAAAQDLFTDPAFRGKGIGTGLIARSLEIGLPCIYSGMSGQARPLYEKIGFAFIDLCPIYRFPIGLLGALRHWRVLRYGPESDGSARKSILSDLRAIVQPFYFLKRGSNGSWARVPSNRAIDALRDLTKSRHRRFQVPWNLNLMNSMLRSENASQNALILTSDDNEHAGPYLVSMTRRQADARIPFTRKRLPFSDAHLNEIYPPVSDMTVALGLISAASTYARAHAYSNLSIYAMTSAVDAACRHLGLVAAGRKTIAIQPVGLSPELQAAIIQPENWWCRALNEEHFEETVAAGAMLSDPSMEH